MPNLLPTVDISGTIILVYYIQIDSVNWRGKLILKDGKFVANC